MRNYKWLLNAEHQYLESAATRSIGKSAQRERQETNTRGRFRLPFQRDRDRIIHSTAFRLLLHKGQVFPCPLFSQYRTRLTHTLEVNQVARSISRRLGLNEDLTEAIALGHDLGHAPFGHWGEDIIREYLKDVPDIHGFEHNEFSLEIVDDVGKLNLTLSTRIGILCHTRFSQNNYLNPRTLPQKLIDLGYSSKEDYENKINNSDYSLLNYLSAESQVVDIADEIAYLTHDLEDCRRAGILKIDEAPKQLQKFIGYKRYNALNLLINNVCEASKQSIIDHGRNPKTITPYIKYPDEISELVLQLKEFFNQVIYIKPHMEHLKTDAINYVKRLLDVWEKKPPKGVSADKTSIAKYLARLTDHEIIHYHEKYCRPSFVGMSFFLT